jgi:hypothetical protein
MEDDLDKQHALIRARRRQLLERMRDIYVAATESAVADCGNCEKRTAAA